MSGKSKKHFLFWKLLSLLVLGWLASCQKSDLILPPSQSSKFSVYLTDSQGNFQAIQINIQQIFIHVANDASGQSGWIDIPMTRQGIYNLSNFQNGKDTLIAQSNVPPGIVSQIRLMLGSNNSVILNNGTLIPLQIPSSLAAGIQLNIQDTLHTGIPLSLDLDWNAANSITGTDNNDQYIFQPVIAVFQRGLTPSIKMYPSLILHKCRDLPLSKKIIKNNDQ